MMQIMESCSNVMYKLGLSKLCLQMLSNTHISMEKKVKLKMFTVVVCLSLYFSFSIFLSHFSMNFFCLFAVLSLFAHFLGGFHLFHKGFLFSFLRKHFTILERAVNKFQVQVSLNFVEFRAKFFLNVSKMLCGFNFSFVLVGEIVPVSFPVLFQGTCRKLS